MLPNPKAERDRLAWRNFREPSEGGLSYARRDPGNWYRGEVIGSKYGVTGAALEQFLGRVVTIDDIAAVTRDQADEVADKLYWRPCGGDLLPSGVNLMVADFGFNAGVHRSTTMLQQTLGFEGRDIDGIVGPMTLLAVRGVPSSDLIDQLHDDQLDYYEALGRPEYEKGWEARADRRYDLAHTLAAT